MTARRQTPACSDGCLAGSWMAENWTGRDVMWAVRVAARFYGVTTDRAFRLSGKWHQASNWVFKLHNTYLKILLYSQGLLTILHRTWCERSHGFDSQLVINHRTLHTWRTSLWVAFMDWSDPQPSNHIKLVVGNWVKNCITKLFLWKIGQNFSNFSEVKEGSLNLKQNAGGM